MLEPIYTYTDQQAIDDGVLVPVALKDGARTAHRVTRNAWGWLLHALPEAQPPERWPVALLTWTGAAKGEKGNKARARAALVGLIEEYAASARSIFANNIGGGILTLWPTTSDNGQTIGGLSQHGDEKARRFWLIPNENQGVTLMFPEDY